MRAEPERLVFLDETATTTKMTRLRGRAKRGQRFKAKAPFGQWGSQTFIVALRCDGLTAPWIINGAMNKVEPRRDCRRPFGLSQAAIADVSVMAWKRASASAGGMLPMGPRIRRWLNQSTHSRVAYSTASKDRHGPRRWITSAL